MEGTSLVSAEWLASEMKKDDFKQKYRILDATWDLPSAKRDFVKEHNTCRIPGAKYFALSECRNKEASLPNTMPSPAQFESYVSNLGVANDHHVILYDNSERFGLFSAPRVWWLFQLFGHSNVSILDGGLPHWKKMKLPTISGECSEEESKTASASLFKANFKPELVKDLAFMRKNLDQETLVQVMDARPDGRFRGIAPEPRPDIPSGHIPKSVNLPFFNCFNRNENVMLSKEEIAQYLKSKNIDVQKEMVVSCGSGISACTLGFATFLVAGRVIPLFDGSWFEWQTSTPDELQIREKST